MRVQPPDRSDDLQQVHAIRPIPVAHGQDRQTFGSRQNCPFFHKQGLFSQGKFALEQTAGGRFH